MTPWLRRAGVLALAVGLLSSCGGSTQIEPFVPARLLVFGDETSLVDDPNATGNGRKYTVNALDADGVTLVCQVNPVWTQVLADSYGLTFPQCNPGAVANPAGLIYAALDANVAGVAAQIDAHLASGTGFGAKDLATVLVGTHDVIDLYQQYPTVGADALVAQAEALGAELARQVIRIADAGGKVLISTVPDIGLSPYAIAQEAAFPGEGRQALILRLVERFNARLRTTLPPDGGRSIGLVLANELVQAIVKTPIGFVNVVAPVCDAAIVPNLLDCTSATLVTDGAVGTWLWADDLHLSPAGHSRLGSIAVTQSRRNPF
jgi:hypothetical protein